ITYILDYDDTQHILMQTSSKQGIGTSRPIVYERLV
ncbi:TPA: staphostatin B, partial [Staphylococcus aureus]|nr:staphostatin B [Staphylococcus aureus]